MQMRRMGISYLRIENICISHIHGDHLFGLFGLLSTMSMMGRTAHLNIFAPRAFGPILKFWMSYFGEGMKFEAEHHVLSMKSPEKIWESKSLEMSAFPLNHRTDTYGFIVREKIPQLNVHKEAIARYGLSLAEIGTLKRGEDVVRPDAVIRNSEAAYSPYVPRSYAYCSDTAPFPELPAWVHGVSLLYHEATFVEKYRDVAEKTFHSTARQAAECALAAEVERLLIGHYSSRVSDIRVFADEAAAVFPDTVAAQEGMVLEVPLKKWPFD